MRLLYFNPRINEGLPTRMVVEVKDGLYFILAVWPGYVRLSSVFLCSFMISVPSDVSLMFSFNKSFT